MSRSQVSVLDRPGAATLFVAWAGCLVTFAIAVLAVGAVGATDLGLVDGARSRGVSAWVVLGGVGVAASTLCAMWAGATAFRPTWATGVNVLVAAAMSFGLFLR